MRIIANHITFVVLVMLVSTLLVLADALPPERRPTPEADALTNVILAIGFAVGGILLFIWLGRRSSKR